MGNNKLNDFVPGGGAANPFIPHTEDPDSNNSEYWSDGRVFIKVRKTPYDFPTVLRSA